MIEFWSNREGRLLDSYRLGKWLEPTGVGASYWTEYADGSQPAVIKLIEADTAEPGRLETWRAIAQLSHPRLVRILDSGRSEIDGVDVLYVVTERGEGNLANVLPERA